MPAKPFLEHLTAEVTKHSWFRARPVVSANVAARGKYELALAILQDFIDCVFSVFDAPPNFMVPVHLRGKDVY